MAKVKKFDVVGAIMDYESGDMDVDKIIDLFGELIKNGMAWTLQGHYGRTATALIDGGYIANDGRILKYGV